MGQQSHRHTLFWGAILPLCLLNDCIVQNAVRTVISCKEKVVDGPSLIRCRYWCLYLIEITKEYMLSYGVLLVWVSERAGVLQHSCVIVDFNVRHPELLDQSDLLLWHAWGRPQRNKKQINPVSKSLSPTELTRSSLEQTPVLPHFLQTLPLPLISDFLLLSFYPRALRRSPPALPRCHSAHLGCLVVLGTSVPVRGAQWGPVEDTKGGLLQLPVTLRPAQQLLGVYSSVLNPHTQPYHKRTSLAVAQRSPILTTS